MKFRFHWNLSLKRKGYLDHLLISKKTFFLGKIKDTESII